MDDVTLFNNALQYHKYLVHNNSANPKNNRYAYMVTRHVMFDTMDQLGVDTIVQIMRVSRWVKRYLKS